MLGLMRFPVNLFDEFERVQRELERVMTGLPLSIREAGGVPVFPALNIGRTQDAIYVYAFAPGIKPETFEVTIEDGLLTLAGERGPWEAKEGQSVYANERFSGKFKRTVSLPEDIDPDQVEAKYSNGVLQVRIARKAHLMPRRISVQ